jgi:hypothetical protein
MELFRHVGFEDEFAHDLLKELRNMRRALVRIAEETHKLRVLLTPKQDNKPVKLVVSLPLGENGMANVTEGLLISANEVELNAEGEQVPASDPTKLVYTVDDTTVGQVVTNADDSTIPVGSCKVKGLKVGTLNLTCTDNALDPPLVSDPVPLTVDMDPVAKKLVVSFATA